MRYDRRYVQFNDLVFDHVDMISADDLTVSFKRNDTPYTFKHGSYVPHRNRWVLAEASNFSMTITLNMKKLPCEIRKYYADFVRTQLAQVGRLWAVSNNKLIWAWAELQSFGEAQNVKKGTIEYDVDVYLPEGIWHKADGKKTFLHPWDVCDFLLCYGYQDIDTCDCCSTCGDTKDAGCLCCECNGLTEDMALCHHLDDLQSYYSCEAEFRIVYDCEAAERFNDSISNYLGQKFCTETGLISGLLYSNTDLESDYVKIRIHGHVVDPEITINGNTNIITGEYDNLLINPDGSVQYWYDCDECKTIYTAEVGAWVVPREDGMTYGWKIKPGNNSIRIDTGYCCDCTDDCCHATCAYIETDPITL